MTSFNQRLSCVFFRRVFTTLEAHSREQYRNIPVPGCRDSNHCKFAQMAATLASHQLDTQFRTLLILYMSETIGFLLIFRPSCRLSSASRKTKKMSQLSSLWATQDILLLSCTVAGAKHGSRQLLGMKQVHVWLFLGGNCIWNYFNHPFLLVTLHLVVLGLLWRRNNRWIQEFSNTWQSPQKVGPVQGFHRLTMINQWATHNITFANGYGDLFGVTCMWVVGRLLPADSRISYYLSFARITKRGPWRLYSQGWNGRKEHQGD